MTTRYIVTYVKGDRQTFTGVGHDLDGPSFLIHHDEKSFTILNWARVESVKVVDD